MSVKDSGQDVVLVAARFPRALYQQLEELARSNMRSVGRECVYVCAAVLRERETSKQSQQSNLLHSQGCQCPRLSNEPLTDHDYYRDFSTRNEEL